MRSMSIVTFMLLMASSAYGEVTLLARWDESPKPDFIVAGECATNAVLTDEGQGLRIAGADGGRALRFSEASSFEIPHACIRPQGSFLVWFRPANANSTPYILSFGYPGPVELRFRRFKEHGLALFLLIYTENSEAEQFIAPMPPLKADTWTNIAMTWDFTAGRYAVYLDGREMISAEGVRIGKKKTDLPVVLGSLWNNKSYSSAQGAFDELVIESRWLTAGEVVQRHEAISTGRQVVYLTDAAKITEKAKALVYGLEGLLRAADHVKLDVTQSRQAIEDYGQILAALSAKNDPVLAGDLRDATPRIDELQGTLRAKIITQMETMPPVRLPPSADWFDTMRPCEIAPFPSKPAEAALDLFLEGFNTYITLQGGVQFTYNPPDISPEVLRGMQTAIPPNIEVFAKITEMCHKLGIRVVLHTTTGFVPRQILDKHPSWSVIDLRTGKPATVENRLYGQFAYTCFNNLEWRKELFGNMLAFARETQPDGFMPDEMHWYPGEYVCGCDICRARFREEASFDIPDPHNKEVWKNWHSPQWRAWVDARRRWISEFVGALHDNVIEPLGGPRLYMTCATGISKPWRWESGVDEIEHARNGMNTHFFEAENSPTHVRKRYAYATYWPKYYREFKLFMAVSNRFGGPAATLGYPETAYSEDSEQFFIWALSKCLGIKYFDYLPKGPQGVIDWERRHADLFQPGTPLADIAVVHSQRTKFLYSVDTPAGVGQRHEGRVDGHLWDYSWEFAGWCETLAENHVPFEVLLEDDMEKGVLDRYRVVILPNVALMKDEWVQAIVEFVKAGGCVLATGDTSRFDYTGAKRESLALAEVFGPGALRADGTEVISNDYGKGRSVYVRDQWGLRHRFPGDYTHSNVFVDKRPSAIGSRMLKTVEELRSQPGPWAVRHTPRGVVVNAFMREGRVVVHLLNAIGGARKSGDTIAAEQRVSYPDISDHNGGQDLEIILTSRQAQSATLFSPDATEPCRLPVHQDGSNTVIRISPSLLHRYSIVRIDPTGDAGSAHGPQ